MLSWPHTVKSTGGSHSTVGANVNTTVGHMAAQQGHARITVMLSTMELTTGHNASLTAKFLF